jgi:hypothetical protein
MRERGAAQCRHNITTPLTDGALAVTLDASTTAEEEVAKGP